MSKRVKTKVSLDDSEFVSKVATLVCRIQQGFVEKWNTTEKDWSRVQDHDLPNGARYSASSGDGRLSFRGFSFLLTDGTWITVKVKKPWLHWYPGFSDFRRNALNSPDQIEAITIYGSYSSFEDWIVSLQSPL